ncbi:ufm1-specific protease 2 [Tribolium castaneum]|uniref:Probable Ufm1-specific protease 2 n=1 Tax=Tribolium castaneum TaxID=7070 RepID=D1ZZB8_TRICA|nr:PREDICTED: ufm1-specific protease 2 [Tribolium castaneum]EFA01874.1 putative Ufm1-specific protease 2-like Protein [Tribolium castaneum]|eukprot:XP_970116.1 PREDICTED: ufm1-specific protease 2 [Tribolium castaneum]
MTPSLKISQKVVNKLSNFSQEILGKLYGIVTKNTFIVLGLQTELENGSGNALINSLPAEIYLCGVFQSGSETFNEQSIKSSLAEVYVTDNPVFVHYNSSTNKITAHFYINGQLETTKFAPISEQEILSQFLYLRLKANVPLTCELATNSLKDSFTNLRKNVASGVMSFGLGKNIYLVGSDSEGIVGVTGNPSIGELFETSEPSEGGARKKKVQNYEIDVMGVDMLKMMTKELGVAEREHAPLCVLDKKQCKTMTIMVSIDSLSMVNRQTKIANLYEILVESAVRNLRLLESSILEKLQNEDDTIAQPEVFHFYPDDCGHFVTKIYLKGETEDALLPVRETLHNELLLSGCRPMFRRANSFAFKTKNPGNEPLINPHLGLKPTDNGGKVALVKGKYAYYHYCQNKMDDNGWGCAYRSLQTLASWFKLQGFTDKEVPTFKDIQKCLVDLGDKPSSFIGSKQWIGSTEVNYVLNTLLGVTCKILYVSSGEEMGSKGPELLSHFENHGSPVMIGGGVLAHTILGVDYNSQSGNLRFLILDPHYTGGEDLHTIQNKGWCGWKSVDFWDKTAYYNMCLPQVPKGI